MKYKDEDSVRDLNKVELRLSYSQGIEAVKDDVEESVGELNEMELLFKYSKDMEAVKDEVEVSVEYLNEMEPELNNSQGPGDESCECQGWGECRRSEQDRPSKELENKLVYLKLLPETKVVNQDDESIEPKKEPSPRLGSKAEYSMRVEYKHRKRDYEHVPDGRKSRIKFNHGGSQRVRYDRSKRDD